MAAPNVLLRDALDVEAELVVELAFDGPRAGRRRGVGYQRSESIGASYFMSITRPTAVISLRQPSALVASCVRPFRVSA